MSCVLNIMGFAFVTFSTVDSFLHIFSVKEAVAEYDCM